MIFDSHTHLNAEQFNEDIPETIQRAQRNGGKRKMAVVASIRQRLKSLCN